MEHETHHATYPQKSEIPIGKVVRQPNGTLMIHVEHFELHSRSARDFGRWLIKAADMVSRNNRRGLFKAKRLSK